MRTYWRSSSQQKIRAAHRRRAASAKHEISFQALHHYGLPSEWQFAKKWKTHTIHSRFHRVVLLNILTKSLTVLQAMARDKNRFFFAACCAYFGWNSQIHSRRGWHIQHDFVFFGCLCCLYYRVREKNAHTFNQIWCKHIRAPRHMCWCQPNNRQKLLFAAALTISFHLAEMMTISQTIDWFFFHSFACFMHEYECEWCLWIVSLRHCVLKMEFQSVTTLLSWNIYGDAIVKMHHHCHYHRRHLIRLLDPSKTLHHRVEC